MKYLPRRIHGKLLVQLNNFPLEPMRGGYIAFGQGSRGHGDGESDETQPQIGSKYCSKLLEQLQWKYMKSPTKHHKERQRPAGEFMGHLC